MGRFSVKLVALLASFSFSCGTSPDSSSAPGMPDGSPDGAQADAQADVQADVQAARVAVAEKSIDELQLELTEGRATSVQLVDEYLSRVESLDRGLGGLRAVLALNPNAREDAAALDAERTAGSTRGPLHGIPLLLKDNIESADELATTAGSLALKDNVSHRDNPAVARLREAGAVILGKTNLSEWANARSTHSTSGWSAVGGLTVNAYAPDHSACGSSSGSATAVAASLAAAALGTETNGSVICPSTVSGVVGLKPTVGLVSRSFIVPISHTQDTAGPMGRTVKDVALLLGVMAGTDPTDPATAEADARKTDYAAGLDADALKGKRLGVLRVFTGFEPEIDALFAQVSEQLKGAGAELVDITWTPGWVKLGQHQTTIMLTEMKAGLNAYLAGTPAAVQARTLEALIAFNEAHAAEEMPYFGQEFFEWSQQAAGLDDPSYLSALESARKATRADGIDALLTQYDVSALVCPTGSTAWPVDLAAGDPNTIVMASAISAIAGYPHLTVPMGDVGGLPVGLSFMGPAWSEAQLLSMGHAFEKLVQGRKPPPGAD
jgi:amidase